MKRNKSCGKTPNSRQPVYQPGNHRSNRQPPAIRWNENCSAFGGGIKAGGPNYCTCFVEITDKLDSQTDYIDSYFDACEEEFMDLRDVNKLYGEQNVFRYLP